MPPEIGCKTSRNPEQRIAKVVTVLEIPMVAL